MAALHPGFTNHELNILWEHRDRIIDAITDPDGLAEEACKLDLMHPETKDMLVSLPVDMKTKAGSLLQSIEGKIRGQPILFHHFLALLKKLPGLADLGAILRNTYDEKVTACVESTNCIDGSTIHIRRDASSCMDQDKYSAIAMQQEDNGRSGGSSDNVNNTGSKKVDDIPKLHELERFEQCSLIIRIIDRVAPKWKGVALRLYFEDHCIEVNEMNCHYQAVPACRTMFTRWLEGYGRKPTTWRTLIIALKEENLYTLAEELEKMFQDLLSTTVSNQSSSSEAPAVVSRKRHLEKSAEEASEKRPCPESNASETNSVNPLLVSIEVTKINPLLKHRPKLAAFYSHQPEVPEGTWPPVKKTQYINLALIRTEQAIDFNKDFLRQTIRGSVDDIIKDKDDIKYADVFTEVEEGARLVFEGRPGCGKTTMMNKVSQDWAMWRILSSSLLFLVHLRRLGNRSDVNLETILHSTPVDFSDEEFQEICGQIESNQGKGVVFALDGLDEYCPEKKEKKTTFIHKLIKGEVLPKSIVIVASRPAASLRYRRNATKCIEVLGFLKDQIYEYIDSYFHESKDKDSLVVGLKTYLEHHPNVMHMCYLPLHMAMVTYLFEVEGASLPQTETEIYRHFTLSTLLRSIRKRDEKEIDDEEEFCFSSFDDLLPEDKDIFDCILELAYQATVVCSQQVFSAEDVQKFTNRQSNNSENNENSLGLVVVDKYFVRYGLNEIYTFLHLTFQEYLSACHIVQLSSQAQEEIILKYGGNKQLGVVWKFYCGMTHFSDGQKMRNFEHLFEKTKYDILLQLHCAHESQQDILCTHTIKSYGTKIVLNSSSLNPADFTALGHVLTHSTVFPTELAITSCNIGPKGLSALAKAIGTSSLTLRMLSFHRTKIKKVIPEFCSCLKTCPQLCTLILSSCGIIMKALNEMAEMLPTLESLENLDLSCNDNLGVKSADVLESVLTKLPNLKSLVWIRNLFSVSLLKTLKGRDIEISFADSENSKSSKQELVRLAGFKLSDVSLVFNYLHAHPCIAAMIGVIDLRSSGIDDANYAESVAKGLLHCTNLRDLHLEGNKIGDAGAQVLVEDLQHCINLQTVDLQDNNIGVAGAQALIKGLQHCTNLQKLGLSGNTIGDAGAQAVAKGLQHCTNLQKLNLISNNIGDAGAQALAEGLLHCTNLQELLLLENSIGDDGAQALAGGLQHCTNLQKLDMERNAITDASVPYLIELMQAAKKLKTLNFDCNKFTEIGMRQLRQVAEERNTDPTNYIHLSLRIASYIFDEEEEKHISAVKKAMKQRGTVDHTIVQGVFVGPARSGKNCLMERLLGRMPSSVSPSTGVAENVVQVKVIQKSSTCAVNVEEMTWSEMDYDDEAIKLMVINTESQNKAEVCYQTTGVNVETLPADDAHNHRLNETHGSSSELLVSESKDKGKKSHPSTQCSDPLVTKSLPTQVRVAPQLPDSYVSPTEIFKEALKNKGYDALKQHFETTTSLYLTNTGGQVEFQEVLPLLVSGPSIFFFTFRLDRDLHEYYTIKYEVSDERKSYHYTSTLTTIDGMLQTLASISAMGTFIYSGSHVRDKPLRPKVFFIGTHEDQLDSKEVDEKIAQVDQQLQKIIRLTEYHKDLVEFASESQLIFTVNNFSESDIDFKRIRLALQRVITRKEFRMTFPIHWLIFSHAIRKLNNRVINYDICLKIARECELADDEVDEALYFIHSKMGLIRYFPYEHIKSLVFVDPQFLFDKVTKLIVHTFIFEKVAQYEFEQFKYRGIFSLEKLDEVSHSSTIMSTFQFGKLLERLRIIAPFKVANETKYFLPCVLALAHGSDACQTLDTPVPTLHVSFECGYVPKGAAGALIAYLMANEIESFDKWILDAKKVLKNEVSFYVGPYDKVVLRIFPKHFEIICIPNPQFPDDERQITIKKACNILLETIDKGIEQILHDMNYVKQLHHFTFPCLLDDCKGSHPAQLIWYKGSPCRLQCSIKDKPVKLPKGVHFWKPALHKVHTEKSACSEC